MKTRIKIELNRKNIQELIYNYISEIVGHNNFKMEDIVLKIKTDKVLWKDTEINVTLDTFVYE